MVTSQLGLRGLRGRGSNLHFTDDQATAPKGDTGEQRARNKVGEETLGVIALLEPSGLVRPQQLSMN